MSRPVSFGELDVNVVATMEETRTAPAPETTFRVAVLGDFSGRVDRGVQETGVALADPRAVQVDRDNIDDVLAKLAPEIHLPMAGLGGSPIRIQFGELDDFHPDSIFERLEVFRALRETRKQLNDPRTFESAARVVRRPTGKDTGPDTPLSTPEESAPPPEAATREMGGSLLDRMLDECDSPMPDMTRAVEPSEWKAFLHSVVSPHLVSDDHPEQEALVAAVDASTGKLMRTILHHPDFQSMETAWRGLHFLVSRLETDVQLKLYLFDMTKAELVADLMPTEDLRSTGIYRLLVEQTVGTFGGEPWAIVAGNYTFDATREDAELLGRMAKISNHARAPFISGAHARLLGCESLAETPDPDEWLQEISEDARAAWSALRRLREAAYIGLALPRFLLRLPYGKDTEPLETFEFEEMAFKPEHTHYLWGNPCFACVCLLGQEFTCHGWNLRPGVIQNIEGLPLHVYEEHGESIVKPCAEVILAERAAESILDAGIMPLLSFLNQDKVRLARFQSLADPLSRVKGRWA